MHLSIWINKMVGRVTEKIDPATVESCIPRSARIRPFAATSMKDPGEGLKAQTLGQTDRAISHAR